MAGSPWFSGSVAEAVNEATSKNAVFLVYIHNGNDDSRQMNEITSSSAAAATIREKTIALKIAYSSEEAALFGQLFPVTRVPSIYMIRSGVMRDYIPGIVTEEALVSRINKSASDEILPPINMQQTQSMASLPVNASANSSSSISISPESSPSSTPDTFTITEGQSSLANEPSFQNPDGERKAKVEGIRRQIEEKRKKREEEEREAERRQELDRRSQGKAMQEAQQFRSDFKAKKAVDDVAKQKREEQEARKRIRAQIELDKAERLSKRQEELALRQQKQPVETQLEKIHISYDHSNLSIRLLNGETIRTRFQASQTLEDARKWIEENRTDGDAPFVLIQNFPHRQFTAGDEMRSLKELDLCPSATLICKPCKNVVSAYDAGEGVGFSIASTLFSYINPFAYSVFSSQGPTSTGHGNNENVESNQTGDSTAESKSSHGHQWGSNIRTLSPDDEEDRRWTYNGNSTNQQ